DIKSQNIMIAKKNSLKGSKQGEHIHDFVELVYIIEGNSVQKIDGMEFKASKGDMLFINYNQVHSFEVENDLTYVDILLTPSFMSEELLNVENIFEIFSISLFKEFVYTDSENIQLVHFDGADAIEIETIIKDMISEFGGKKTGYISILSGYMRVLFSKLLRRLKGNEEENVKYMTNITPDVMEYIDKHCYEKITLSQIAQKCFYTPSYFSHAFKKYCGKSLSEYVKKKRITYALELLEHTDYTVSQISEMVGYNDKTFFYKIFREAVGKSPAEYRNSSK
ncbi:MAG: AraC family transcriptional regulator, partial [Clostridia bacterium]|nr:AraC family transcriptional regulator [Clostridia bacterium]